MLAYLLPALVIIPGVMIASALQARYAGLLTGRAVFVVAAAEAFIWVAGIQLPAELALLYGFGEKLRLAESALPVLSFTGLVKRVALVFPLFVLRHDRRFNAWVGLFIVIAWTFLFSSDSLLSDSLGLYIQPRYAGIHFLIFTLSGGQIGTLISGLLWFISLTYVRPLDGEFARLLSDQPKPNWRRAWLNLGLIQYVAALGLVANAMLAVSIEPVRGGLIPIGAAYVAVSLATLAILLLRLLFNIRKAMQRIEQVASEQLRESERKNVLRRQQISRILQGASAGVFFWNARYADLQCGSTDWQAGQFDCEIGHLVSDPARSRPDSLDALFRQILVPSDHEKWQAAMFEVFHHRRSTVIMELNALTPDGELRAVKVVAHAIHADKGPGVLHFDGLILDFQDELALRKALHTSAEIRMQTLYSVGHDLGSPLGLIKMSTSLMRRHLSARDGMTDYLNDKLARVDGCVMEAYAYLKNALDLARSEDPDHRYPANDLEVDSWLRRIVEAQQAIYAVPAERVSLLIPEGAFMQQVQEQALQMVVTNLVSNAFKYGGLGGGMIAVSLMSSSAMDGRYFTVLEVSDEGAGIPKEVRDVLYRPFRRGEDTGNVHGTGLGLTVVRHAIACLGATIELLDVPRGTRFRVTIPIRLQVR